MTTISSIFDPQQGNNGQDARQRCEPSSDSVLLINQLVKLYSQLAGMTNISCIFDPQQGNNRQVVRQPCSPSSDSVLLIDQLV